MDCSQKIEMDRLGIMDQWFLRNENIWKKLNEKERTFITIENNEHVETESHHFGKRID